MRTVRCGCTPKGNCVGETTLAGTPCWRPSAVGDTTDAGAPWLKVCACETCRAKAKKGTIKTRRDIGHLLGYQPEATFNHKPSDWHLHRISHPGNERHDG